MRRIQATIPARILREGRILHAFGALAHYRGLGDGGTPFSGASLRRLRSFARRFPRGIAFDGA